MKKRGIETVLQIEMKKQKVTVPELVQATRIPRQTIYSMLKKTTFQVDIINLKKILDYLEVNISIFFELENYQESIRQYKSGKDKQQIPQDEEERTILSSYQKLNRYGKNKIQEYLGDLAGHPKYTTISSYQAIMKSTSDEFPLLSDHKIREPEDYRLYYNLCIRMLGAEMIRFADMYLNEELSKFQFEKIVFSWENYAPEILYENQDEKIFSKELLGYIGEDRTKLINGFLKVNAKINLIWGCGQKPGPKT